MTHLILKQ